MSDNENKNLHEFDYSSMEIENPIEVETGSIAESVKTFSDHSAGTEEMEYYEDEIAGVAIHETVQSAQSATLNGKNKSGVNTAVMRFDDESIIHRKGNSGVMPDLELLPTDSIRIPADEIKKAGAGDTDSFFRGEIVMDTAALEAISGRRLTKPDEEETKVVPDVSDISDQKAEEDLPEDEATDEETPEYDDAEDAEYDDAEDAEYDDDDTEMNDDEEDSDEEEDSEEADAEEDTDGDAGNKAGKKVIQDVAFLPEDEIDDDVPVSEEELEELGDLSYHDDVVKKKKKHAEAAAGAGTAAGHESHKEDYAKSSHGKGNGGKNASDIRGASHAKGSGNTKGAPGGKNHQSSGKKKKNVFDILLIVGAVAAIAIVCILTVTFLKKTQKNTEITTLASAGNRLESIGNIGQKGIEQIVANKTTTVIEPESEEKPSEKPSETKKANTDISVNFSSIEKDLKIKFSNKQTDTLIKGVLFRVEARTPDNKTVTWEDSDKDGIIYMENLTPGKYYVKIVDVEDYKFPDTETEVTVKDKISYTAINIVNEIKKESEINVATEAPNAKIVDTGEVLSDTVGWVDSKKETVYTEISKDKIVEPQAMLMTPKTSMNAEPTPDPDPDPEPEPEPEPEPVVHYVTDVTLSKNSTTLTVGQTDSISATVSKEGDDVDGSVTWSSSDSGIATVDGNGQITAVAKGSATITCTTNGKKSDGNSATATCTVTVNEAPHYVTGVTLSKTSTTLTVGQADSISATVSKDGEGVDTSVTWSSSNSGVATVDGSGKITAVAKGSATITCMTNGKKSDGSSATATCSVTVNEAVHYVTGVTLDKTSLALTVGQAQKITASVSNDGGAVDSTVSFSTSNADVASVAADGTITAKAAGSATITCTTNGKKSDGNSATATCAVTVSAAPAYVSSLTLDKTTASIGINATLKLVPTVKFESTAGDASVTWASSDANIATVGTDGTVTGKAKGKVTITCTTVAKNKDGKTISASCALTVNNAMNDTTTPLTYKKEDGTVVNLYVKDGDTYREAKYADYYKFNVFYLKEDKKFGWQNESGGTRYYNSEGKYVTGEQVIGGVKYNFANDGILSMGNGIMGIDVSTYQGNIDWNAVKQSGVSFVIIRCGYRGYTKGGLIEDSKFHANASGAEAAGLKVGVYFFSQAVNEREAVEEASMAITMAQRHRISYPIFIDSEYANGAHNGRADGLSKAQRTAVCRAFCETIRSAGYTPGVYASKSWYYNNLDVGSLNNYKIWLAHYCTATDYRGKYDLWQSSSKGRIGGINGNVDINTSYMGY